MTHDAASLSARNRAVAQTFKANDPDGFAQQRSQAGKLGFKATGGIKGWARANEFAAKWRREHPSGPEQKVIAVLDQLGIRYEREFLLPDGKSVDFVLTDYHKVCVEVNGHQHKPSFGEDEPRWMKQQEKIQALIRDGWKVIIIEPGDMEISDGEIVKLNEILKGLQDGACKF